MWLTGRKNYNELDDLKLIELYQVKSDRKAVGALFERYSHLVFGVCMKYLKNRDDSQDATISIFEKAMTDLKRFEIQKFNFWIHRVARNYCLMQLRSKKMVIHLDDEFPDGSKRLELADQVDHRPDKLEEKLSLLEEGISLLNEEQRICIELFYLKKYCYQDVSEISGFTMNEVKSYIQNGKRNLKNYMLKQQHENG